MPFIKRNADKTAVFQFAKYKIFCQIKFQDIPEGMDLEVSAIHGCKYRHKIIFDLWDLSD